MSIFDKLNYDTILYIFDFLDDKNKINFTSIEKEMNLLKYHIKFYDGYKYYKIKHLSFIKNFKRIYFSSTNIPNCITHLIFGAQFNQKIKNCIPNSVTHLTFGYAFNQKIKNCIPNNITHLTFGRSFNQKIKDCIPNSVTHLIFGVQFNRKIKNYIPNSVSHLTFGFYFNQEIKNNIPNSVTHLTFGHWFNQEIKDYIPNSVTHLTFGFNFNQNIKDCERFVSQPATRGITSVISLRSVMQALHPINNSYEMATLAAERSETALAVRGQGIPNSVTHLTFSKKFSKLIESDIPSTVKYLKFRNN